MIEFKNNFRIEYTKGDTYALKLTFKNVTQDLTSAIFSVKENAEDETALIEKTIGSGISKIKEDFYKNEVVYKLQLQAEDSRNLQADNLYLYDLKIAVDNVIKTVIKGNFVVTYNVTSVDNINTTLAEIEVDDVIETDAETTPATAGIEYEQDPIAMAKIGDITQLNTTAKQNLVSAINEVNTKATASAEEISKIEDGTVTVPEATHATSADSATNSTNTTKVQNINLSEDTTAQFGDYIVSKKKLLWSGDFTAEVGSTTYIDFNNIICKSNTPKIAIEVQYNKVSSVPKTYILQTNGTDTIITETPVEGFIGQSNKVRLYYYTLTLNINTTNDITQITRASFVCLCMDIKPTEIDVITLDNGTAIGRITKIYEIIE